MAFLLLALLVSCNEPTGEETRPEATEAVSIEDLPSAVEVLPDDETEEPRRIVLQRPPLPTSFPAHPVPAAEGGLVATAFQYNAAIFEEAQADADVLGIVRRGRTLPVGERVFGPGCNGRWYRVGRGFLCTGQGFSIGDTSADHDQKPASFEGPMPYGYAAVSRRDGVPRLFRPPTPAEEEMLAGDANGALPEVVSKQMVGDFFVALDRVEGSWQRTVRGRYVHTDNLNVLETPKLTGSPLGEGEGESELPLAFVFGETRPLLRIENGAVSEVGEAEQYARFHLDAITSIDGVEYAVAEGGLAVRREFVRVARRSRPDEAVTSDSWIHVDLAEQTLVAYSDGEPVYATLVASGREGYDTPRGVFRIREKYVSATMDGSDPVDGDFEVEEVPWTMYYWRSFALHGAYWHDDFGQVRSHGCTNLAPADARWLFEWTGPSVPDGWHGYRQKRGTWVWLSRGDAEYDDTAAAEE